jgi:hypothetical protein
VNQAEADRLEAVLTNALADLTGQVKRLADAAEVIARHLKTN